MLAVVCLPAFTSCDWPDVERETTEEMTESEKLTEPPTEESAEETSGEPTEVTSEEATETTSEEVTEATSEEATEATSEAVTEAVAEKASEEPETDCPHAFGNWDVNREATCTEDGEKSRFCSECGETESEIIPATGHTEVVDEAVEATCTETGLTEGKHCGVCGEVLVAQTVAPAKGHMYLNRVCVTCGDPKPSQGLVFTSNGNGTCYVSGIGICIDNDIVIPTVSPEGDRVTGIGDYAFNDCEGIDSIMIPEGVTTIGDYALSCKLRSVTLPDSVTSIGKSAFSGTRIKSITIPRGVTSIEAYTFRGCYRLTSITIPNSVTSIGHHAFQDCQSLPSITIPEGVTLIDYSAFAFCYNLSSITISKSVTLINDYAFNYCKLESITVEKGNPVYHSEGNCLIETQGKVLVLGCINSVIPTDGSVTSIAKKAFTTLSDNLSLMNIVIPSSVTSISDRAFYLFSGNLASITVEEGNPVYHSTGNCLIETATKTLILGCPSSVIPADGSVETIKSDARVGGGASLIIPDSVKRIETGGVYYNETEVYENGLVYVDRWLITANYGNSNAAKMESVEIRPGTIGIADSAFSQFGKLTSVTLPDSLRFIGKSAFVGCTSLSDITLPEGLLIIEEEAFYHCESLEDLTIPDSVMRLGSGAFYGCYDLIQDDHKTWYVDRWVITFDQGNQSVRHVELRPDTVGIGDWAFRLIGFDVVKTITIPETVTKIGSYAFERCSSLTDIYFTGTKEQWHAITVGDHNDCLYTVPIHCTDGDILPQS